MIVATFNDEVEVCDGFQQMYEGRVHRSHKRHRVTTLHLFGDSESGFAYSEMREHEISHNGKRSLMKLDGQRVTNVAGS